MTLYIMNLLLTYNPLDNLLGCCICHLPFRFSPSQLSFLMSTRRGWRTNNFICRWWFF